MKGRAPVWPVPVATLLAVVGATGFRLDGTDGLTGQLWWSVVLLSAAWGLLATYRWVVGFRIVLTADEVIFSGPSGTSRWRWDAVYGFDVVPAPRRDDMATPMPVQPPRRRSDGDGEEGEAGLAAARPQDRLRLRMRVADPSAPAGAGWTSGVFPAGFVSTAGRAGWLWEAARVLQEQFEVRCGDGFPPR